MHKLFATRCIFAVLVVLVALVPAMPNWSWGLGAPGSAWAQDADDDDDDDDGADGGVAPAPAPGPGGGGGGVAGIGDEPFVPGDGSVAADDPTDCFDEALLQPSWLRDCEQRRPLRRSLAQPALNPGNVRDARPATPRSTFETFDAEQGFSIVETELPDTLPREIVAIRVTQAQLDALVARGYTLLDRVDDTFFGGLLLRLEVPSDLSTRQGLNLARQLAPGAAADLNHIYRPGQASAAPAADGCDTPSCRQRALIGWPKAPAVCGITARLGVIDTAIDRSHPAFSGQSIDVQDGVSGGRARSSDGHGTAVLALLAGRADATVPGLLPLADVVAVEAFHKAANGEDIADTFDVVRALDVLLRRNILVINLSFTGPANELLLDAVRQATSRNAILIASAGNFGPTSPPVYPAGYDDVLAATAVSSDLRLYSQANRGRYIDIAAPGVEVEVVAVGGTRRYETGTSFATPYVTAAIAASLARSPGTTGKALVDRLARQATDLGRPGRDTSFGWGLLQAGGICP